MIKLYLAGGMRAGSTYDRQWRDIITYGLQHLIDDGAVRVLNPYSWQEAGTKSDGKHMVDTDFHGIDHADIVLFNFTGLAEGYPSIGTLVELGRTTTQSKMVYLIVPPGHEWPVEGVKGLHPFLRENCTTVFANEWEALDFLQDMLPRIDAKEPFYAINRQGAYIWGTA